MSETTHQEPSVHRDSFITPFLRLFAGGVLITGAHSLLLGALPIHLHDVGVSSQQIGVIVGAYAVGGAFFRLVAVKLVDRLPYAVQVISAGLLMVLGFVAYLLTPPGVSWIAARLLQGMGLAFFYTTAYAWIGTHTVAEKRGRWVGLYGTGAAVAVAFAPPLGLLLLNSLGARSLFVAGLTASVVMAALCAVAGRPPAEARLRDQPRRDLTIWIIILAIVLSAAALGAMEAFMSIIAKAHGVLNLVPIYLTFGVFYAVGRLVGGALSDKAGRVPVALIGLIIVVSSVVGMWAAEGELVYSVLAALFGIGMGAAPTAMFVALMDVTPPAHQGRVVGLSSFFYDCGVALGAAVAGYVSSLAADFLLYYVMALVAGSAGVMTVYAVKTRGQTRGQAPA